jgi:hypothetical protein
MKNTPIYFESGTQERWERSEYSFMKTAAAIRVAAGAAEARLLFVILRSAQSGRRKGMPLLTERPYLLGYALIPTS